MTCGVDSPNFNAVPACIPHLSLVLIADVLPVALSKAVHLQVQAHKDCVDAALHVFLQACVHTHGYVQSHSMLHAHACDAATHPSFCGLHASINVVCAFSQGAATIG